ncbi:MAG: alpha/beta fold hydrolase [Halolamina sp.]
MFTADPPPEMTTEGVIDLSDGRQLGYAEYGPPDGDPLLLFHGTPGSRYTVGPDPPLLDEYGFRLISLERPGFGKSTFDPDREILDWPADVQEAIEVLDLDQFAILGGSGGGPYVLACAVRIPERLTAVGVVSGISPLDAAGVTDEMAIHSRIAFKLFPLPGVMWPFLWMLTQTIRILPEHPGVTEGLRQGPKAPLYEHRLQTRSWGFDLSSISNHVHLWYGQQDTITPVTMGEYIADQVPSSSLQTYPAGGHLLLDEYGDEILSTPSNR